MTSTVLWISGLVIAMAVLLIWLIQRAEKTPRPLHMQKPGTPDTGTYTPPASYGHSDGHSADAGSSDGGGGCGD